MTGRTGRDAAVLVFAALVVGGCFPQPVSREGREIGSLYQLFFVGGCIVAALVWGLATIAIIRFRRRSQDAELPRQVEGNTKLEVVWTAIPLVTVLILFGATYVTLNSIQARAPEPSIEVRVTAFRWGWQFDYPATGVRIIGDVNAPPEMVVPVGEPLHITLEAVDVLHAFYVPRLLYKLDMIPGRVNSFDITVETPGTYGGVCAEFCGTFHDKMPFTLRAVPRAEFDAWLAAQPPAVQPTAAAVSPTASAP